LSSLGLNELNKATGVPGLNRNDAYAKQLYVPPLDQQRRIAAILDQADDLRRKRQQASKKLHHLQKSIFFELFGDPTLNPAKHPLKELKSLGRVVTGSTPSSSKEGMFGGPVPFVTPGDLETDAPVKRSLTHEGARQSRTVRAGSALVCCIGATIGKMGMAAGETAFNQQINAVEWSDEIDAK